LFVLSPELRRSAVWVTAGVLSVRIARCNEAPAALKVNKIRQRS
jgi:hypothetical protein